MERFVPDLIPTLLKRYQVLQAVEAKQPIGRRSLAELLGLTERILRKETDFLKEQGLLFFSAAGISISKEGEQLLAELNDLIADLLRLPDLEEELQRKLGLKKVVIVPGDSQQSPWIKRDLGRAAVEEMKQLAEEGLSIAVTGGSTLAAVAEAIPSHDPKLKHCLYLPARGGLGEEHENQANTICSQMAKRSGGSYRLLYVPEQLSKEAADTLALDPQIAEMVELIRSSRMIIHGVGDAITMAIRRKSTRDVLHLLEREGAVAEAFGYYFDRDGEIVYRAEVIGLRLEDVRQAEHVIAVAGGKNKAEALLAFSKAGVQGALVTDEGAALEMKRLLNPV